MCESLTAMNRFITVREEARVLNGAALGDDVVAAITGCGSVINDWLRGATTRAEALRACCTTASRGSSDVARLRKCIKTARHRINKASGEEARTVCTGMGMQLRWDSINHTAAGPISPEHLVYPASAIRMYGWIQLGLVTSPLGYEGITSVSMMDQLLAAMLVGLRHIVRGTSTCLMVLTSLLCPCGANCCRQMFVQQLPSVPRRMLRTWKALGNST